MYLTKHLNLPVNQLQTMQKRQSCSDHNGSESAKNYGFRERPYRWLSTISDASAYCRRVPWIQKIRSDRFNNRLCSALQEAWRQTYKGYWGATRSMVRRWNLWAPVYRYVASNQLRQQIYCFGTGGAKGTPHLQTVVLMSIIQAAQHAMFIKRWASSLVHPRWSLGVHSSW